jgi:hypothetical protein
VAKNSGDSKICIHMNSETVVQSPPLSTRMNYRTKLCKYGDACHYGTRCFFAHSEDELRPRVLVKSSDACGSFVTDNQDSRQSSPLLTAAVEGHIHLLSGPYDDVKRRLSLQSLDSDVEVDKFAVDVNEAPDTSDKGETNTMVSPSPSSEEQHSPGMYIYYLLTTMPGSSLVALLNSRLPECYTD